MSDNLEDWDIISSPNLTYPNTLILVHVNCSSGGAGKACMWDDPKKRFRCRPCGSLAPETISKAACVADCLTAVYGHSCEIWVKLSEFK